MDTCHKNYITATCFILTTGILSACGGSSGSNGDSNDSVTTRSWGIAELIETDNAGGAFLPKITVNTTGDAVAVWSQSDGIEEHIWAKRYFAGSGWVDIELISTDDRRYNAADPQVAVDASGNAVAVWRQNDGTRYSIWSNRFTPQRGWRIPELIEANDVPASSPQIAMNTNGDTQVIWAQDNSIWANRYTIENGWETPELINTNNPANAFEPKITIDSIGNTMAIWSQSDDGEQFDIWANHYTTGSGWGTAELIENISDRAYTPQITSNSNGIVFATWSQNGIIYANRYTVGVGWNLARSIENFNDNNSNRPQITIDDNDNAIAVWRHSDGIRDNIWANKYTVSSGWGTAELIETNDGYNLNPKISSNASGNAVAVWTNEDSTGDISSIMANQYSSSNGWGTAELIDMHNGGAAFDAQISTDAFGNAIAVWQHYDGIRTNIWTNQFE